MPIQNRISHFILFWRLYFKHRDVKKANCEYIAVLRARNEEAKKRIREKFVEVSGKIAELSRASGIPEHELRAFFSRKTGLDL